MHRSGKRRCDDARVANEWLDPQQWWRAGQGRSCDVLLRRDQLVEIGYAVAEKLSDEFDVILYDRVQPPGER